MGIHYITVTFEDPCHNTAVLTPAQFDDSSVEVYLFDPLSFLFIDFQVSINCLGKTQELIYSEGPLKSQGGLANFLKIENYDADPNKS